MRARPASFGDFRCAHCHMLVSSSHGLSGVNNRNHCPYCLWSCHLDLFSAGDRLSACKAPMKPVGLTMKKGRNKYQHLENHRPRGELMLIHECTDCQTLSINRIAADDDSATVLAVFESSLTLHLGAQARFREDGIIILDSADTETVQVQLYGQGVEIPALSWA
jgi:hypothetical protein